VSKKPTKKRPTLNTRSLPISFRLDRALVANIQTVADGLGVARNKLVALVLREYLVERNTDALAKLLTEEPTNAVDLFA